MRKPSELKLNKAANYRSNYVVTVDANGTKAKTAGYSTRKRVTRWFGNIMLALSVLVGSLGIAAPASAEPGLADFINQGCATEIIRFDEPVNLTPWDPPRPVAGQKMTGLEKFGWGSTKFTDWLGPWEKSDVPDALKDTDYPDDSKFFAKNTGGCVKPMVTISTTVAQGVLGGAKMFAIATGTLYELAISADSYLLDTIYEYVDNMITGEKSGKGLKDALYLDFLIPVIMLGALYLGYVGLMKRQSTKAIYAVIWMVAVIATGIMMLSNPMWLPTTAQKAVTSIAGGATAALTQTATSGVSGTTSNLCAIDGGSTGANAVVRQTNCMFWYAFAYRPWVEGQFGSNGAETFRSGDIPRPTDLGGGQVAQPGSWAVFQLDQMHAVEGTPQSEIDGKTDAMLDMSQIFVGDPAANMEGAGAINRHWTGENPNRLGIATMALVASICTLVIAVPISLGILAMKIGIMLLVAFLPFILLVAVIPGFGQRIALRVGETIISFVIKQIVQTVYLGLAVVLIILALGIPQMFLATVATVVLTWALIKFQPILLDLFSVNLGGGGPLADPAASINNFTSSTSGKAMAIGTGMAVGAASAIAGRNKGGKPTTDATSAKASTTARATPAFADGKTRTGTGKGNAPATESERRNFQLPFEGTVARGSSNQPQDKTEAPVATATSGKVRRATPGFEMDAPAVPTETAPAIPTKRAPAIPATTQAPTDAPKQNTEAGKPASDADTETVPAVVARSNRVHYTPSRKARNIPLDKNHVSTSNRAKVPVHEVNTPKRQSILAAGLKGAAVGGTTAAFSGARGIGQGAAVGMYAGKKIAARSNSEQATRVREAEQEAAEKASVYESALRVKEQKGKEEQAQADREAKAKERETERTQKREAAKAEREAEKAQASKPPAPPAPKSSPGRRAGGLPTKQTPPTNNGGSGSRPQP